MEKIVEKIEDYNLFNYLLPGIIFSYALKYYLGIDVFQANAIEMIFIYYFIGSVISRIGSVFIEAILIKIKYIEYAPYDEYLDASKKDNRISKMVLDNNMYRTILAGTITLLILKIIQNIPNYLINLHDFAVIALIVFLILLYLKSFKKQTKYIYDRVKKCEK